jgi:hypothetical protein
MDDIWNCSGKWIHRNESCDGQCAAPNIYCPDTDDCRHQYYWWKCGAACIPRSFYESGVGPGPSPRGPGFWAKPAVQTPSPPTSPGQARKSPSLQCKAQARPKPALYRPAPALISVCFRQRTVLGDKFPNCTSETIKARRPF